MSSVKDDVIDRDESLKPIEKVQSDFTENETLVGTPDNSEEPTILDDPESQEETSFEDDVDVISYVGAISREGYTKLTQIIEKKVSDGTKKGSLILVLTTGGGDPDYGYRIGRAINHYYDDTAILIPDICKSAGTLVAIAAKSLIIGDLGELGPLDIQFRKTDEMGEQLSTLNISKTVNELQNATLESFRHFVTDIRYGSGIGTKLSSEIASNLTKAMISPIAAQIDPIKLGEHNRALQIATDYATRLDDEAKNLVSKSALQRLVSGYPCHSFVIDRKEAQEIFKSVRKPSDQREALIYLFSRLYLDKGALHKAICMHEIQVVDFHEVVKQIAPEDEGQKDDSPNEEKVEKEAVEVDAGCSTKASAE
ncbi:hypothetical protein AB6C44_23080 [Vibrio splendidus]